jgi:hypothetical protein
VYQYNKSSGANSKIIRVKKASTPTPLSCDFLMDMVIRDAQGNTRMMETSRRMNVRKVGTTCDFDYVSLENSNTGFFIQENSPETAEQVSFSSAVQSFMKATNDALGRYMDGVSSANQVSDKNVRDTMTREQNAQQEEASARALATARTADGMRTLSQCSIAANSRTILDIIERMIREILRRDPLNAADFSAGTVAIRFDKWGYDNTTNTVILDYNVSLTRRWRQFRHIGGFRFYTGLCSPPRIDKATIFIMEAGLTPNTWREPGPANRFFVSPLGEIKNSPSTDTDTVNILSNGSQATNFFVPPPPPPPPPPTLTIHSARWGRSGNTIDVTDTIRTRIQNNASQISLDQFILGTLPGDRRNQHFYTLSIEYSFGNGPRKTFSQTESRTNSFINVSSLT